MNFKLAYIFLLLAVLVSCTHSQSVSDTLSAAISDIDTSPSDDLTESARLWADSVAAAMTDEQLAGQVLMPATYAQYNEQTMHQLSFYINELHVGGIAFHKGDTQAMHSLSDTLLRLCKLPLFLAIDAENGLGMRLKGATVYPLNYQLQDSTQTQMYDYGNNVGRECKQVGINMVFGPVLDVAPGPGRYMYKRSLGSDPQRVADLGAAYARGLFDVGVLPVAKHFPGHGYTRTDPHVWLPVIDRPLKEIENIDLLPFKEYIAGGFPAIMAAHVAVPALSGDSLPSDFSDKIINTLLRKELNFNGLIISDAVNMGAVKSIKDNSIPAPVRALLAGVDIILAPSDTQQAHTQILTALTNGTLPRSTLQQHTARILFYKYLYL
ncbi:MAG: hypothetical protein NC548_50895 [Lachnospiraceae bacterium]|nr:hypothetical protein [Lachnospiraceae bacterium]